LTWLNVSLCLVIILSSCKSSKYQRFKICFQIIFRVGHSKDEDEEVNLVDPSYSSQEYEQFSMYLEHLF